MTTGTTAPIPDRGTTDAYGLSQPTLDDARNAVHALYGPHTDDVWQTLLFAAGLTGKETNPAALDRLLAVMQAAEPVIRLCARNLQIRVNAYRSLAARTRDQRTSR